MNDKVYYGQRNNYVNEIKLDLNGALRLFRNSIDLLIEDLYFFEATGYYCTDKGRVLGKWGSDIDIFIYEQVWPVKEYYVTYTEDILFTMIEFIRLYI